MDVSLYSSLPHELKECVDGSGPNGFSRMNFLIIEGDYGKKFITSMLDLQIFTVLFSFILTLFFFSVN